MNNKNSTKGEAVLLAAVLRSRGKNNSLFDINRAAEFLENAQFADASASVGTHLSETVKGRSDHPADLAANPTSGEGTAREAPRDNLDKAGVPAHTLVALKTGPIAIKPIEWEHSQGNIPGQEIWHTGEPWIYWIVKNATDGKYVWCENLGFSDSVPASPVRGAFDTLNEAKAAAQADFEERIRACLTDVTSDDDLVVVRRADLRLMSDALAASHDATRHALRLCQQNVMECLSEHPNRQTLRLAVFNALEMPTINCGTAARLAERLIGAPAERQKEKWWDVETEQLPPDSDEAYVVVRDAVLASGKPLASFIQRRFGIGYNRASRFIDRMEAEGIISAWNDQDKGRTIIKAAS